mmetsp:Transcript_3780/g.23853  ORF Transcript_3780/g.23853 Transcript_3780/m.23853 type:complete len:270 (+) Transcript_3780:2647-3456(+)
MEINSHCSNLFQPSAVERAWILRPLRDPLLRNGIEITIPPFKFLHGSRITRHGSSVSTKSFHQSLLKLYTQLLNRYSSQLVDQGDHFISVLGFHIPDRCSRMLDSHQHERRNPDEFLHHAGLECLIVQHFTAQSGRAESISHGLCPLAIGGSEPFRIDVCFSIDRIVSHLGDGKVDEHLGVTFESSFLEPRQEHAVLQEHEVLPPLWWRSRHHVVECVVPCAHEDRTLAFFRNFLPSAHQHVVSTSHLLECVSNPSASDDHCRRDFRTS